jgi:hypothetical protein|tara:strand:+ start:168 stop:281 length:114 start_codon:yes stop_codon:yes gene_type:complete
MSVQTGQGPVLGNHEIKTKEHMVRQAAKAGYWEGHKI